MGPALAYSALLAKMRAWYLDERAKDDVGAWFATLNLVAFVGDRVRV